VVPGAWAAQRAKVSAVDHDRLGRAKDFIADEQWLRAIHELRLVLADRNEPSRDEAAFWLAHSLYQAGDTSDALATIEMLEREHLRSRWVKPARSLRIEISHRLRRSDELWLVAAPPAPPPAPAEYPAAAPDAPPEPPLAPPAATARPVTPRPSAVPSVKAAPPGLPRRPAPEARPSMPAAVWGLDMDLRIQALSSLMSTDAHRVVPILREIALNTRDEAEARRAILVLAQSNRADARSTIVEVARTREEPLQVAAVKLLAQQGWTGAEKVLLEVYRAATPRVKRQVIRALGSAGARQQLRGLFDRSRDAELKLAIINALFEAGARDELARIARQDNDAAVRRAAQSKLGFLAK
jgi:hypothetical protein